MNPGKSSICDAKPIGETVKGNGVINIIECCRKVYEADTTDLLVDNCCDEVIVERKESSFG